MIQCTKRVARHKKEQYISNNIGIFKVVILEANMKKKILLAGKAEKKQEI